MQTLELDTLNLEAKTSELWILLITVDIQIKRSGLRISNSARIPFNFLFNPLLDIIFPTSCIKDTFDYKYRYDALSIELLKSAVHKPILKHFNKYKLS